AATDVQAAIDELEAEKLAANAAIVAATNTKITYDVNGLVTAGAAATTADIAASADKNYVTDAQLTVIGNTSGANSGDQASIAGITGTLAQFNTALTDDDFVSLTGTETLTNKTLTSPTVNTATITGGTINNTTIGGTTPSTAEFTTLNVSGRFTINKSIAPPAGIDTDYIATVSEILDAGIIGFSSSTTRTLTLPTAQGPAGLVQALPGTPAVGDVYTFYVYNTTANAVTLAAGTGITIFYNPTIIANRPKIVYCRVTDITSGSEAISVY
ncbi:MAG: hypothetical protein KOO66_09315, partial [Bacteroidales bacterium]|nr:hypothetical protein [Bacteroidales bacterium]